MEEFGRIIVSETAMNSENPQDVIHSNISVINLMREEGVDDEFIHEDAITSYYLDYYYSQYTEGNFSQFVYNSGWNKELNELIEEGLTLIGAEKHLELFQQQSIPLTSLFPCARWCSNWPLQIQHQMRVRALWPFFTIPLGKCFQLSNRKRNGRRCFIIW